MRLKTKVTTDSMGSHNEEAIFTKMNDLDLCLEVFYGHVNVNHCVMFAIRNR